jgi:hypothetical protein
MGSDLNGPGWPGAAKVKKLPSTVRPPSPYERLLVSIQPTDSRRHHTYPIPDGTLSRYVEVAQTPT